MLDGAIPLFFVGKLASEPKTYWLGRQIANELLSRRVGKSA